MCKLTRLFCLIGLLSTVIAPSAGAAPVPSRDFSLEVSPSPLVATVTPGTATTLDLRVHNASTQAERLTIQARGFTIAHPSEQITITTTTPPDLAQWIRFSEPTFTLAANEWKTQKVTIDLPESAGFSYPFVIVISRSDGPTQTNGGASLKGSIAVFTLVNIDKPGATRKLEITSFKTDRGIYEYLPTAFTLTLKNTGNSIVQPYGNIYVQRAGQEDSPLAVLPVNEAQSYLLPGSSKEISRAWSDGFPVYEAIEAQSDKTTRDLRWNWGDIAQFRFGRYTAKVVAVYNDGTRDVPVVSEVSFWVIPWRILLGVLVVLIIIGFGLWSIVRRLTHHTRRIIRRTPKT